MKLRIILVFTVAAILVVLGVGAVLAATPAGESGDSDWGWHDRMHSSEQMRQMHREMPEDLQGDCDRMHTQMRAGDHERMQQRMHDSR